MLAEIRAHQALPAAPVANQAEPPADPNFNWARLVLPPVTNFQVPGDGQVQRMSSLVTRRIYVTVNCLEPQIRVSIFSHAVVTDQINT